MTHKITHKMTRGASSSTRDIDHHQDYYSDTILKSILTGVTTFAMVGASLSPDRPSHIAGQYMVERGYQVIPINPSAAGEPLFGHTVRANLAEIDMPIDVVQVFRRASFIPTVLDEALAMPHRPRVLWLQLDIVDFESAARAEAAGLTVIMNRCPKIEHARLFNRAV